MLPDTRLTLLEQKLSYLSSLQDTLKFHEYYEPPLLGPTLPSKFGSARVKNPLSNIESDLSTVIIDLNDRYKWTREQIADWLDTLDQQPVFYPHIKKCLPYYVRYNVQGPPNCKIIWACSCSVSNNSSEIVEYAA